MSPNVFLALVAVGCVLVSFHAASAATVPQLKLVAAMRKPDSQKLLMSWNKLKECIEKALDTEGLSKCAECVESAACDFSCMEPEDPLCYDCIFKTIEKCTDCALSLDALKDIIEKCV